MDFLKNILRPDKWSLGTLADAAGLAGGLISGGTIPGSADFGFGLSALGGLFGSNSSGGVPTTYTPGPNEQLLQRLGQGDLQFALNNQGKRQESILGAFNALDPRNDGQNAAYFQNSLLRGADMQGRRNANDLQRRGYASSVGDAAMLDARNRATEQGNEYFAQLRNPINMAQRYAGQADLLSGTGNFGQSLSGMLSLQNNANNQRMHDLRYEMSRPPTGAESLTGLLGQLGPYLTGNKKSGDSSFKKAGQSMGSSLSSVFGG